MLAAMSRPVRALIVALITAGALGAGASAAAAQQPPAPGKLYVVQAEGGSLRHGADGWRLVLNGAVGRTTTFTDRPARVGGTQSLRRFVAAWSRTFGDDPPNAALQLDRAPASRDVVLLELQRPRYDARHGTLSFAVRPLKGTARPMLRALAKRADQGRAGRFGRASLFIDDGSSGSIGYGVTFNVIGESASNAPITLSLTLDNAQFEGGGQLIQTLSMGQMTTPSVTVDLSAQTLSLTFPGSSEMEFSGTVTLPSSGSTVTGTAVLPTGYQVQVISEEGTTWVSQSGPMSFPSPPPP